MPSFWVHTFGCQMNAHDSERMEEVLASHGWTAATELDGADLIVFNTCSVREKAEQKLRSEVGRLAKQSFGLDRTRLCVEDRRRRLYRSDTHGRKSGHLPDRTPRT